MTDVSAAVRDADFEDRPEGELTDIFAGLVQRLEQDALDRVSKRLIVEERWLLDQRQYEGQEDDNIVRQLRRDNRSTAVVNVTRSKCNTFESKTFDMLFPTDDKNWGVDPTPVPELDAELKERNGEVERLTAEANVEEDDDVAGQLTAEADQLAQRIAEIEGEQLTARKHADLMGDEIEDNLVECEYAIECRKVIHDGTVGGTGILKGPIPLNERVRKNWLQDDAGVYRLKNNVGSEDRFAYQHTSYWNVFPDTSARHPGQVESWMERHVMRRRGLIEFAKQPGVDKDAIREILREGPQDTIPQHLIDLDTVANEEQSSLGREFFLLWEYRGPLEIEEMEELLGRLIEPDEDGHMPEIAVDPLTQVDAVVWFCQGRIVRVGINHMDDNAPIYSFFQIERSDVRFWSVGIPFLMRTQAAILNDAWRGMMDNAAFGAFPIFEIDESVIQPAGDGSFQIRPGAVFQRGGQAGDRPGLILHSIPVNQEHYAAIIQLALEFFDQETNVSVLASGEQGPTTTRTAGGMALLMNATNVVFRRVVKNFDDGITTPAITRAYYYLMQFSEKEDIKGDFAVQARGSSVLLVREVQAQNLLLLVTQLALHPSLAMYFKLRPLLKKLLQSMMIASDDVLNTQQEFEAALAQAREEEANAPPDPALVKLQLERDLAQMEGELKFGLAQMEREGEMVKLSVQQQVSLEQVLGRLQAIREQNASKERIFSAEAAIEGRQPPGSPGSGGYLSAA